MGELYVRQKMKNAYLPAIICGLAVMICVVLYPSSREDTGEDISSDTHAVTADDAMSERDMLENRRLRMERLESRRLDYELRRHSSISYHADNIETVFDTGRIILSGRAWYNTGGNLLNGSSDPNSMIILDMKTLRVIESSGEFRDGGVILGLAK